MAMHMNHPVIWQKSVSLDRDRLNSCLLPQESQIESYSKDIPKFDNRYEINSSFLYSARLKQSLQESRKAFLNLSLCSNEIDYQVGKKCDNETSHEYFQDDKQDQKKACTRKISYKIKRTSSVYRKPNSRITAVVSGSTVAELASKFDKLVSDKKSILEDPKFARLVKRVNSQKCAHSDLIKVVRKPSVKMKHSFKTEEKKLYISKRPSVVRKVSIKKIHRVNSMPNDDKQCVRAKISYLESPQCISKCEETENFTKISTVRRLPSIPRKPTKIQNNNSVRAAIEIFEKRTCPVENDISNEVAKNVSSGVPKPKVPEKKFNTKTIDLISKNSNKKFKVVDKTTLVHNNGNIINALQTEIHVENYDIPEHSRNNNNTVNEKTDFDIPVHILDIPVTSLKRCESSYETLNFKIKPRQHIKSAKSEQIIEKLETSENIKPNSSFLWRCSDRTSSYNSLKNDDGDDNDDNSKHLVQTLSDSFENVYDFVDSTLPQNHQLSDTDKRQPPSVFPRTSILNLDVDPCTVPKKILKKRMPEPDEHKCQLYEDLAEIHKEVDTINHNYEYCNPPPKYEDLDQKSDDGYETVTPVDTEKKENIYETLPMKNLTLPPLLPRRQEEPLPPRPPSKTSYYTIRNAEDVSNCYESIYNANTVEIKAERDNETESNYESIYGCQLMNENWGSGSNRDSIVSSDQQSNSLYGRAVPSWTEEVLNYKATSVSSSDRSDEWIDLSDNEDGKTNSGFILVREKQKITKRTSGWSQQLREQRIKSPQKHAQQNSGESDSDHHYESLCNGQRESHMDSDSFDSDSDCSFAKTNIQDIDSDIGNAQLPDPPYNQPYVLTRLAVSAGKHMKRLRRNWSLTKNDITKSLSRMTKRKSHTNLDSVVANKSKEERSSLDSQHSSLNDTISNISQENKSTYSQTKNTLDITQEIKSKRQTSPNLQPYENVHYNKNVTVENTDNIYEKHKNPNRKGFLKKFRRSMSLSAESASELTQNLNKPQSTFYLTEAIDIDKNDENNDNNETDRKSNESSSTTKTKTKTNPVRPQIPPPPLPIQHSQTSDIKNCKADTKRATSWYAECGLFKNTENVTLSLPKRPNTCWYAEVGLYQTGPSTPSSSSAENSGSSNIINSKNNMDTFKEETNEEYYNLKNENHYYNHSIASHNSADYQFDKSLSSLCADMQLLLQEEPLYQFYDAAVMESVCQDGTSDMDYDGYEQINDQIIITEQKPRPSAMELITPLKNSMSVSRTLWCEVPEVVNSTVLSTLSSHQKKLQEAKFEMMTSEASYLNSLNVLTNHFIKNLTNSDSLTSEEKELFFGKITEVKNCSEKLLQDLEKCWQENILLHGVCEVVHRHAKENFYVYITYCENQILLDNTLKKLKDRTSFYECLRQLESNTTSQGLTLHSFLMLPMQRITRWPLLLDAVSKGLSPQDDEYLSCQYALTTTSMIAYQCNEGARKVGRESEMKEIVSQIEFPKNMLPIPLISGNRWLVRSGPVTQMLSRGEDVKLTFGKRFTKVPLFLFLFNDLFLVTKYRSNEDNYLVMHYCLRSLIHINKDTLTKLPLKDSQGRNLIFLTILENQEEKLVELLLSCNSDSDKERWLSAILPRESEDPEETLYECWDCPQVTVIHNYNANQPDELLLSRGDIINVSIKMADGWYYGERIRDGLKGWFPSNYVEEIANPHVRARNLKQRYRLLAFSEIYLKSK